MKPRIKIRSRGEKAAKTRERNQRKRFRASQPVTYQERKRGDKRIGRTGTVRLYGTNRATLRERCFQRDQGICRGCGRQTKREEGNMAHKRGVGAGGADKLSNVRWLCSIPPKFCRQREHAGTLNGKPCPPKEVAWVR